MSNDGSGRDISIPSFLMTKMDSDTVKTVLKDNKPVLMELSWGHSLKEYVEYDVFVTPHDVNANEFLTQFKHGALALGDKARLTPHMYIHDGDTFGCRNNHADVGGSNACDTLCTNNGRYCATHPLLSPSDNANVTGADVVRESLRRICIWETYADEMPGSAAKWWNYVEEFHRRCMTQDYFAKDACIRDVYKYAQIDSSEIDSCMVESGDTTDDGVNTFLDRALQAQQKHGVVMLPSAYINDMSLDASLTTQNLFSAICGQFQTGAAPEVCTRRQERSA